MPGRWALNMSGVFDEIDPVARCAKCGVVFRSHEPNNHAFESWAETEGDGGYDQNMGTGDHPTRLSASRFMTDCGLAPTEDAVGQLVEVFLPCLRIMCERGYDPTGATWKEGGWRSQLVDIRKKFSRMWFHGWIHGEFRPDHGTDLINYVGYYQRLGMKGHPWGKWGEPE
jgi:hypothetical protein